ncbi:calaxin-like [Topomyia yanbarensis]|uniref:calaxin-like n=1 Tax=Topomyia yanbarensis TaxID=2498891 RepID=UPI00273AFF3D|nr:calaxin-like [Topomyia yanbarensis]
MSIDTTLKLGEEIRFLSKISSTVRQLVKRTHFTMNELEVVLLIYYKLLKDDDSGLRGLRQHITRHQFTRVFDMVFGLTDETMLGRIYSALDRGVSSHVTMETWATTVSLFLRGSFEEKIRYCFQVYDIQGDGVIRRDHMMLLMKNTAIKHQEEDVGEVVKDLVDIILHRMDADRDGSISFQDYQQTVRQRPELLECFGQALPDRARVHAFSKTFLERGRKY